MTLPDFLSQLEKTYSEHGQQKLSYIVDGVQRFDAQDNSRDLISAIPQLVRIVRIVEKVMTEEDGDVDFIAFEWKRIINQEESK